MWSAITASVGFVVLKRNVTDPDDDDDVLLMYGLEITLIQLEAVDGKCFLSY